MESWKDVVGYEVIYEVSNTGKVRSKEGKTTHSVLHGEKVWKSRILKEKNPKGRDVRVSLWKNKKDKSYLVHQLVAKTFIPNPSGYKYINHLDGNPRNNNVDNLEWCDHYINNNHAFDNDLMTTNKRVVLRDKATGDLHEFRSLTKADLFLGKHEGYLSNALIKSKPLKDFDVFVRPWDFKR